MVKSTEADYYKDQFQATANNSKKLWQNLNKLCSFAKKGKKQNININKLVSENKELTDPRDICNCLNNYFCNVAKNIHALIKPINITHMEFIKQHNPSSVYLESITKNELLSLMDNINLRKSPGSDNIGPKLINDAKNLLIDPLVEASVTTEASYDSASEMMISSDVPDSITQQPLKLRSH